MWAGYTVGVSIGAGFGVGDVLFGHWFPPRVPCPGQCHCVVDLFVLGFYGPVNPMGSCRARSVYLTTRLLGRLSPLSG